MNGTHVRSIVGLDPTGPPDLSTLSRAERIATLRAQMAEIGAGALAEPSTKDIVPAPEIISEFLPDGGLMRRAVSLFPDQPSLVAEFLAYCTKQGGHAAVVGWQEFGFAGVIESGGVAENLITIPDPGLEPLNVTAVLCEGMDLVVYYGPPIRLSPARARPLLGKVRNGAAALIMVGTEVAAPALRLNAEITNYQGIGQGRGRIRGVEMGLAVMVRGQPARSARIMISRPEDASLLAIASQQVKPQLRVV